MGIIQPHKVRATVLARRLAVGAFLACIGCAIPACQRQPDLPPVPAPTHAVAPTETPTGLWFVRAGAAGDGTSPATPLGSSAALQAASKPGDVIVLLSAAEPLDGGLELKPDQTLMGISQDGHKPSITNSRLDTNGGNGIVLADRTTVLNVRVVRPQASGVLGLDVSGVCLAGVEVEDANRSAASTTAVAHAFGPVPHGGILFIDERGKAIENRIQQCTVTSAAGIGIGSFALGGGQSRLLVSHTRVTGGAHIAPLFDVGVVAWADGRSSEMHLELADTAVSGRLSKQGRNVLVFASADAKATARIERSTLGESGQDGVCAVAALVPATVNVEIRDSTIEKAAQTNLEGSILNLPASDPARAQESVVSIDVERCTIRDAGAVDGFRDTAQNIWLGPTFFVQAPFAKGHYHLAVRDSTVQKALKTGVGLGYIGSEFGIAPDEGEYQVTLKNNLIADNGSTEISIAAANAHVDARQNCWGVPEGLADERVRLQEQAQRSQLDASQPIPPTDQNAK